jgi:WD40 repeat protein
MCSTTGPSLSPSSIWPPAMIGIPTRLDDSSEFPFRLVAWSPDGDRILGMASSDRGTALVSFSTDSTSVEVLTPWTWAFEFTSPDDITWRPSTDEG